MVRGLYFVLQERTLMSFVRIHLVVFSVGSIKTFLWHEHISKKVLLRQYRWNFSITIKKPKKTSGKGLLQWWWFHASSELAAVQIKWWYSSHDTNTSKRNIWYISKLVQKIYMAEKVWHPLIMELRVVI